MAAFHRKGFGSIELLCIVVILGFVIVLTLKGTALIPSMRAFILAQQITQYQMAVSQYQTDYRALPGDDADGALRWSRSESLFNADRGVISFAGDGRIDGLLDDATNPLGEQYLAWSDLRAAGLISGDPKLVGQSARPDTISDISYGFAENNLGLAQVLCLMHVPGADAAFLDKRLDDGDISTGRLRGTSQWDPTGANNQFEKPDETPYDAEKTYIICLPYMP